MSVEGGLGGAVIERGAGPRQRVDMATGDLPLGQRLTEALMAAADLGAAHRRPRVTQGPATPVGDHRLSRLRLA